VKSHPSEEDDLKLTSELVFNPNDLILQKIPRGAGKTADLQVILKGQPIAYCEVKSPRNDWLDVLIDSSSKSHIVGGAREDPIFKKIRKHANKASKQFEAVNMKRNVPNILVFVNHDESSDFNDLREAFTGLFHASNGSRHATMLDIASSLNRAKSQIDLCVWIDGGSKKVQSYFFNQDTKPNYLAYLCNLLRLNPAQIKN
jgi:hypothetical protein